jgi:hypothetical protein
MTLLVEHKPSVPPRVASAQRNAQNGDYSSYVEQFIIFMSSNLLFRCPAIMLKGPSRWSATPHIPPAEVVGRRR